MARFHNIVGLAAIIALPVALGGCAGALVVGGLGAAAGGGYAAAQERGVDGAMSDFTIKTNIEKELIRNDPRLQQGVTTTVYQGRVLLTGQVPGQDMKMLAEQIAGRESGVRALYDEIEVGAGAGTWDDAKDAWITTRVRSDLVLDSEVRSVNYTIDTANGSVYLIGSARSQAELDRATQIARYVPGVRRVVSYVEIRYGSPVAAMPPPNLAAPPPVSSGPGGIGPAPAPRSPIEVQKL